MKKTLLILLLLGSTAFLLNAQHQKTAVVNLEKLFDGYYKTQLVEANLKRQSDIYREYMLKLEESLKKLREEFTTLRDASQNIVLSDAARESRRRAAQEKYAQMQAKQAEIRDYNRDKTAQIRDEQERERNRLFKEISAAIEKHAVLGGYTLVLDVSARGVSGFSALLYHDKRFDITEDVLKELNIGRRNPAPAPAQTPAGKKP